MKSRVKGSGNHLKHADEARDCLKEGLRLTELAEEGKLDDPTLPMPLFWIQRLELQILRREAKRVINTDQTFQGEG